MKKIILALMLGVLLTAGNLYADGDLEVVGNIEVGGNIIQTSTGRDAHFKGFWLENGDAGGFVRKNGYSAPLISSDSVFLGGDGEGVAFAWDTIWDGQWAYCEGVTYDTGTINCANYTDTMDSNDIYWVWKHGHPTANNTWCKGDCQTRRRDLKFVFDGESNDGVMGFMEDEDAFFFDEKVGIGTRTPQSKLSVVGLPTAPPVAGTSYIVCIDPAGNMWIDDDGTNDCS